MKTNIENIKKFPELFGRVLAEKLGRTVKRKQKYGEKSWWFSYRSFGLFFECERLANNLYHTHEAELQVIETVGIFEYLNALCKVFYGEQFDLNQYNALLIWQVGDLVTANASQKLCAMLLALGVLEVEDEQ